CSCPPDVSSDARPSVVTGRGRAGYALQVARERALVRLLEEVEDAARLLFAVRAAGLAQRAFEGAPRVGLGRAGRGGALRRLRLAGAGRQLAAVATAARRRRPRRGADRRGPLARLRRRAPCGRLARGGRRRAWRRRRRQLRQRDLEVVLRVLVAGRGEERALVRLDGVGEE